MAAIPANTSDVDASSGSAPPDDEAAALLAISAGSGATTGADDDLLAKLAGDEIDRLLAAEESDESAPPDDQARQLNEDAGERAASRVGPANAIAIDPELPRAVRSLSGGVPPMQHPAVEAEQAVQQKLSALRDQLGRAPAAAHAAPAGLIVDAIAAASTASDEIDAQLQTMKLEMTSAPTAAAIPVDPAQVMSDAAKEVARELDEAGAGNPLKGPANPKPLHYEATDIADRPIPLIFRPLEWLSAPLEACPDWVGALIGRAAIVTTINAIAIIAYVMIFRRPGHS